MPNWTKQYETVLRAHCRLEDESSAIAPDIDLALLGIDSLEIVSLVVDLEDLYGIQMPEDLLTPDVFATPGTLWDALASRFLG